ncbi:MAG: LON peptidase substrate-binding domain-containing protein [Herpetosiphonaceae bacterium]|nr:LON peptidase substrate-binding domain-containing protein [Herpetosiphonaceae bacterium]
MHELLALFPLHMVLFPGELLPLRIFEERYKQMIGQCLTRQEPFGVVLIHSGAEAFGELARPHSVGTSATIIDAIRFEDGQYYIATQGGPRFRVHEIVEDAPYLVAAVEFLEDEVDSECQIQADHLRELYNRYRSAAPIITSSAQPLADLPLDPIELSFRLSEQLQVTDESKQHLLEADLETRLEALTAALEEELRMLPPVSGTPKQHLDGPWSLN